MSRGKYSPAYSPISEVGYPYNARKELPVEWNKENYCEETMVGHYDAEGYDHYGYSGYESDGNYVGMGEGVDRNGYTENEYLRMSDEEWEYVTQYGGRRK